MYKIISAFILLTMISSCNKDLLQFSCDPELNEFIKSNTLLLSQIRLDEFNRMSSSLQRAAFRCYTPEKRFEFWMEKLEKTLIVEIWTEQETSHIENLINHLSTETFTQYNCKDTISSANTLFALNWQRFAINELKWDKVKLAFVISSLFITEADFKTQFNQSTQIKAVDFFPEHDCSCNTGTDFCSEYPDMNCKETGCSLTSGGCGWLWMEECNGQCD